MRRFDEFSWRERASCQSMDMNLFFPETDRVPRLALIACEGCPVADECLEYALTDPMMEGVWAGTTKSQRSKIRRRRMKGQVVEVRTNSSTMAQGRAHCLHCGQWFTIRAAKPNQRYCSAECQRGASWARKNKRTREKRAALSANKSDRA